MIEATCAISTHSTCEEWTNFAWDAHRYASMLSRCAPLSWAYSDSTLLEFRTSLRLPSLSPLPAIVHMTRTSSSVHRIQAHFPSLWENLPPRLLHFSATLTCEPAPTGTKVTHTVSFHLPLLLRWLIEPALARSLPLSLEQALHSAAALLEKTTLAETPGKSPLL